ncbi:MAG: outer rane lipoprotein LolB [Pseudomonadota bacterium]|jgi:outer membrane lipoprotein LolB
MRWHGLVRRASLIALLAAIFIGLTACSTLEPNRPALPDASPGWPAYQANIELQGRISVQYQARGKDEALHGSFEWRQQDQQIDITLRSPLGDTLAQIQVTPGAARLQQAGAPERVAADIDSLMAQTLGWPLPVAGLRHWLQGQVPGAAPPVDGVSESTGWRIRFVSRHPNGSPRRIDLERFSQQAGEVRLRLIIDTPA